jgi:hypothetical protein
MQNLVSWNVEQAKAELDLALRWILSRYVPTGDMELHPK